MTARFSSTNCSIILNSLFPAHIVRHFLAFLQQKNSPSAFTSLGSLGEFCCQAVAFCRVVSEVEPELGNLEAVAAPVLVHLQAEDLILALVFGDGPVARPFVGISHLQDIGVGVIDGG